MDTFDVDLFVIGGGSGGVRAARIAANHGARVMLAEEFRYGGTCVIRGCVPKKLLVYASRFAGEFADAAGFGWHVGETSFDWATLIRNKDAEITRLENIYAANLESAGVSIVRSRAVIEDAHTVRVLSTGARIRATTILVATGATPVRDASIPGIELAITSNEAFNLDTLPQRVLVIGAGYIAVEFAGIFAGLGARTSLVYRGEKLLRGFDEDVRTALETAYTARGIGLLAGRTVSGLGRAQDGSAIEVSLSDGTTMTVDAVLSAIGRRPNVGGLGLDAAGVALKPNGAIPVDGFSRTNVPSIYAVGDVTDRVNLTPVAIREGHAFADTVFGGKSWQVDHSVIPTAVFSTPEIGTVGLTEAQAREKHADVAIFRTSFRAMKATLSGGPERVLMKIVVDRASDRVLGVHIVGEAAGEMIQLAGIAVTMGATKADFDRTIAVHPSAAEELVTLRTPVA
ncbi:glutathione-disulfide reductase [Pseudochelatococcus lubricantis]|uniref:glutathione-disulfide reductase n=1 Tax=Pseudochelatococcus lubricantis TaxID=1538102 RepID=UPI0035ED4FEA